MAELRGSRRRLLEAADDERRAIERALHDGVQQDLIALAIDLRRLSSLLDRDRSAAGPVLDDLLATITAALDDSAELARRIYPPMIESRGLASALRAAAEDAGVTLMVDIRSGAVHAPGSVAAIYWSCAAALSSAPRGSRATVEVRDAGGAATFEIAVAGRLGDDRVERLRDRLEAMDGGVTVEYPTDGGSRLHGWLSSTRRP